MVFSAAEFAHTAAGRFQVDPARPEHFQQLLTTVFRDNSSGWRGVLHFWSLNAASPENGDDALTNAQIEGCGSVLHLVQALVAGHSGTRLPIWLATRGVQPVGTQPAAQSLAQSPVWGLGRVVALEHPELWGGLIDLDPQAPASEIDHLLRAIRQSGGEDQLALRGQQSYVARLRHSAAPHAHQPVNRIRPDATYLITGGRGELGLKVASWLVDRGATHLALLGRTPLSPDSTAAAAVQTLEQRGASVALLAADVGDRSQMATAFGEMAASMPPLRGVVHAAGVLENRPLAELSLDALQSTLRPKVAGTWVLQQLAGGLDLDFFVLFSSMTSVLGWRYTGHYAAANHFLDTFAHYRSADGQPAQSINWGPWSEVGMVSRSQQEESFARMGIAPLPVAVGLAQLDSVMADTPAQVAVIDANWERFDALYQAIRPSRLLAQLNRAEAAHGAMSAEQPVIDRLRAAPRAQWQEILVAFLRQKVAHVLRVGPERISGDLSVVELGLDSIMAMEVTWACNEELSVPLLLREVFEPSSLTALAGTLAEKLAAMPANGNGANATSDVAASDRLLPANGVGREPPHVIKTASPSQALTSLVPLRAKGSRTPLFLVPPGASTVLSFGSLVQCLDSDQPVYGLEPLGMDGRHPPQWRVEDMASHYINEMRTIQPQGPYLLGGRCFGGLVVFEMAQQLRAQGQQVAMLAILDTLQPPKPGWLRDQSPESQPVSSNIAKRTAGRWVRNAYLLWKRLTVTDAFTLYTLKQVLPEDRFPNVLGEEARHIRNTARAHYEANELYLPRLYEGRLTLFSNAGHSGSHQLNWAALTAQAVDIHVVPGNHLTMFKEPYVRVLAEVLTTTMEQALQRAESSATRRLALRPRAAGSRIDVAIRSTSVHVSDTDHRAALPDEALEREIGRAYATVLGAQPAANDPLPDLADTPFVEAYLLAELERALPAGNAIALPSLIEARTVSQLAHLPRLDRSAGNSGSLIPLQPNGSHAPFFLVPDIDQTVASLVELAKLLNPQQPCYGLQPPGLEPGQRPYARIEDMAACFLDEMRPVQPNGPYCLGGIGFGGIVAFEMAQQLQAAGESVVLLAVLDTMVPPNATLQYWYPPASVGAKGSPPHWFVQRAFGRLVYMVQRYQLRGIIPRRARSKMSSRRRLGHQFSPAARRIQAMLTAHYEARLRYQPQIYSGRITLFSNAKHTGAHQVKWALLTEVGMEIEVIPGDHRSIFRQPGIAELANRLSLHLEQAQIYPSER
ncbi:MAG: SDR family NAD(P)-dependent oxidoreductase [Anaerolineae bacterium]|nr:SDR family NAD(P)-dependent oxidoreductase [Anaerolineae bacterium]